MLKKIKTLGLSMMLGLIFTASPAFSQSLYDMSTITQIEITFGVSNWDAILDTYVTNDMDERLLATVKINGIQYDSCGVQYKGNSTYNANNGKNPLNIKLDYVKNQDYGGWETLKLSNGKNDPSFVREALSYQIARKYMDAPRSNFAEVYINGVYYGAFTSSESIDADFQNKYLYADKDNSRFKCNPENLFGSNGANLQYLGADSASYYTLYEIKSTYGWNDLIELCDTVTNNVNGIEDVLQIDRSLWMLAFNNVLVNLDSYTGPFRQNYYVIKADHGRNMTIVWDLNESLGGFETINSGPGGVGSVSDLQQLDPFLRQGDSLWPLIKLVLGDPTYTKMYIAHMRTILAENFTNGWYSTRGDTLQMRVGNSVNTDPNAFYSFTDFVLNMDSSVATGGPGGSTIGITELMEGRVAYLTSHAEFLKVPPTIWTISTSVPTPSAYDTVTFTANVGNASEVFLGYRQSKGDVFTRVQMFDDGLHNDGAAGDSIFGVDATVGASTFEYFVYAQNNDAGIFSPERAEHEFYELSVEGIGSREVVINEFLASNASYGYDQDLEFDDWIEIFNPSSNPVDLTGYHLTDNGSNLTKFTFPDTTLGGWKYLIVWCDGDTLQNGLHTSFKLSSTGEEIHIVSPSLTIVDEISYGPQTTNISNGRCMNGFGSFWPMTPTFAATNNCTTDSEDEIEKEFTLTLYPNPARDRINIDINELKTLPYEIFDLSGRLVHSGSIIGGSENVTTASWPDGIYFIRIDGTKTAKFVIHK